LVDNPERKYSHSTSRVLIPARDAVFDVIPALRKIEQMAEIPNPAAALDLGGTEGLIAMDKDMHGG